MQRITLAADDPAVALLATIDADTSNIATDMSTAAGLLGTIDADTGNIVTSVQLLDDAVYVDDADWTDNTSKHLLTGGVYQATPHTVTDGDVTPFLTDANGRLAVSVGNTVTVASHAVTNAGTFAVQVDGNALTALQLIDDVVYVDDADWTDDTSKHALVGGVYQSSPHTVTDGDVTPFLTDVNGRLAVAVGNTVTVGSHAVTNAGTFAVQVDGNALTALQLIDNTILVDDAAFTPGTSSVNMAGFQADETATDSVDEGDAGAARMTLDRKVITTAQPHTAGGLSTFNASGSDGADTAVLSTTAVAVKASAGQLYGWYVYNPNDEASVVNFYNIAQGSVTVGTSNVKMQLFLPAGAAANVMSPLGIPFSTAITVSATKTAGSNTAPDVGLDVQLFYA